MTYSTSEECSSFFRIEDLGKMYIVGELESHEILRKLIADMRIELKALEVKIKEKLRSKFVRSLESLVFDWSMSISRHHP